MLSICVILAILSHTPAQDRESLIHRVRPYVASVTAFDKEDRILHQGFGIFVSDSGDIVANKDTVWSASRVQIITADGRRFNLSRLVAQDAEARMVLFHVETPNGLSHPVNIARSVPGVGEQVGVLVSGESGPSITLATVKNVRENARWSVLQFADALPADSAG